MTRLRQRLTRRAQQQAWPEVISATTDMVNAELARIQAEELSPPLRHVQPRPLDAWREGDLVYIALMQVSRARGTCPRMLVAVADLSISQLVVLRAINLDENGRPTDTQTLFEIDQSDARLHRRLGFAFSSAPSEAAA